MKREITVFLVKTRPPAKSSSYADVSARRHTRLAVEFTPRNGHTPPPMLQILIFIVSLGARAIRTMCRRRADLVLENLTLRQQMMAFKKERPRPPLEDVDRAFWGAPSIVASVGKSSCHRQGRHRCAVASGSVQAILGEDFPGAGIRDDLASTPRPVASSGLWRKAAGVLLVSTPSSRSSASSSQRRPCRDTCRGCQLLPIK